MPLCKSQMLLCQDQQCHLLQPEDFRLLHRWSFCHTETIGADKVEIVPVYRYENVQNVNNGITLGEFEEGLYNITFKKNGKARCDIYVNGAMVGNNIDQSGEGRKPSSGSVYTQFH